MGENAGNVEFSYINYAFPRCYDMGRGKDELGRSVFTLDKFNQSKECARKKSSSPDAGEFTSTVYRISFQNIFVL